MKSEAVPALAVETELKKEENLGGDQKADALKENAASVKPEPTAVVPVATSAPAESEKMEIDEPIKVEKESPVAIKEEAAAVSSETTAPTDDTKMDIEEPVKVEKEAPLAGKDSEESTPVPPTTSGPIEIENIPVKRTDVQPEAGQSPSNTLGPAHSVPVTTSAPPPNTAPSVEPVTKPAHPENIIPAPTEPNVNDAVSVPSQSPAMNAPTPPIQTAAPNVYGYYSTPYLPPPMPSQYYPPMPSQYYPGPYQGGAYSPYFHPEPSQNPTITTPTPPIQTSAQNVAMPPTSQPTPLAHGQIPAPGPMHHPGQPMPPQVQMPPAGAVPPPPPHGANPNPHAGLPTPPPPPPQSH